MNDIHWAAGFLEGEGSFTYNLANYQTSIQVAQVQVEPLERLHRWFGGRVCGPYGDNQETHSPYYRWIVTGPRARGVMHTVYSLMSPRRKEQIRHAIPTG